MKRFFLTPLFLASTIFLLVGTSLALAQGSVTTPGSGSGTSVTTPGNGPTTATLQNPLKINSIGDAINTGIQVFTYLAIFVAVIALIWVGLKFITARGNPGKVKEAGQWLGYIVIGVAIILGARLLISILLSTLQATGTVNPNIINSANQAINGK